MLNLKEAEKKAFRATFQDGLWDIYLGLIFVLFGILPLLDEAGLYRWLAGSINGVNEKSAQMGVMLLYYLFIWGFFWVAKKYITTPRIGLVKFGKGRKRKMIKVRVILSLSVLLGVLLFFATKYRLLGFMGGVPLVIWIFSVNLLLVFGLGAYFLDYTRLYAYTVFLVLSFPLGMALADREIISHPTLPFLIPSGMMLLVGLYLFIRFLVDYPLPKDPLFSGEAVNGNH